MLVLCAFIQNLPSTKECCRPGGGRTRCLVVEVVVVVAVVEEMWERVSGLNPVLWVLHRPLTHIVVPVLWSM